jgi:hypothetical protein
VITRDCVSMRELAANIHSWYNLSRFKADGAEAPPASDLPPESVDSVSLQESHERVELAFRQTAFGDSRNPLQYVGLRHALGLSCLDDELPATHMQLHLSADSESGALKPRALQAQQRNRHRTPVRPADPERPVAHREPPDLRALDGYRSEIVRNGILCRHGRRNSLCVNHGLLPCMVTVARRQTVFVTPSGVVSVAWGGIARVKNFTPQRSRQGRAKRAREHGPQARAQALTARTAC